MIYRVDIIYQLIWKIDKWESRLICLTIVVVLAVTNTNNLYEDQIIISNMQPEFGNDIRAFYSTTNIDFF